MSETVQGVMLPLIGTSIGAACVFPMKREPCDAFRNALSGFAAGVMAAAGVWSLLIPAIEGSFALGKLAFLPAAIGLMAGTLLMLLLDRAVKSLCKRLSGCLPKNSMLTLAVTLHNIPEGMVVGAAFAGVAAGEGNITAAAAMTLAVGIAIQNFPEGAMISMPLKAGGMKRAPAFFIGVLSGVVEPIGAAVTLMAADIVAPALPYILSMAAGAMYYVAAAELIPESAADGGAVSFAAGFTVMMSLDVLLG
ncbi:MAG: ZIP family metal transporter [Ruminococcus sp.]|nr:ZIP family metal transporter [Ruminococcus sp.]